MSEASCWVKAELKPPEGLEKFPFSQGALKAELRLPARMTEVQPLQRWMEGFAEPKSRAQWAPGEWRPAGQGSGPTQEAGLSEPAATTVVT